MKKIMMVLLSVTVLVVVAWTQEPSGAKPEILILGTYHMANPGRDVFNMQADDVQSEKRQKELSELLEVLKRFRPTKIAIEREVGSQRTAREYADYLAGKYTLSRNEIDQIGYRLAKELGHKQVYSVDVDGDFPMLRVINYAKANGLKEKWDALQAETGRQVKEQGDFLQSHTILETLDWMNSDRKAAQGMASYFAMVPYGEPWEYAGPDLLASWYQRNIRIYHNVVKLAQSPQERILVIYGAGHLGWLREDVNNDASVKLRKLSEFTSK